MQKVNGDFYAKRKDMRDKERKKTWQTKNKRKDMHGKTIKKKGKETKEVGEKKIEEKNNKRR